MKKMFLLFFTVLLITSCAQMTRFETGKTIGENNLQWSGQGLAYADFTSQTFQSTNIFRIENLVPVFQGSLDYGLAEKVDIGIGISSALNVIVNGKFQIIGDHNSRFAMSINPALEVQIVSLNGVYARPHLYLPMSWEINERQTFILEPRYSHAGIENAPHTIGFSSGIEFKMKKGWKLAIGGSVFLAPVNSDFRYHLFQLGIGAKKLIVRE